MADILLDPGQVENPLLADTELYRNLVETVNDGVITIDEAGTILFANHAAERIFGYGAAELVGASLTMLMPERLRTTHLSGFHRYLATGQRRVNWDGVELPGLHKDGEEIPLEISYGTFSRGGRQLFSGIIRDITERKRAEEVLRQSQQRYEDLVDSIEGIVWEADPETFRFTFVSKQGERLLGYPREEWLAAATFWADHIHPEDREWAVRRCENAVASQKSHDFEYRMLAADGRVV